MQKIRIKDIFEYLQKEGLQPRLLGDSEVCVQGFSSLNKYRSGTFTWVKAEDSLAEDLDLSHVSLIISQEGIGIIAPNVIYTPQSKRAFFGAIDCFFSDDETNKPAIGEGTYISPKVKLGQDVRVGCNCVLDGDITIGDGTVIGHNVVLVNRVVIGCNCVLQSGIVIGHDGLSYTEDANHKKRMNRHYGGVTIGDDVYMCMQTRIVRGVIDDTVIESGVRLSPGTHIGHNVIMKQDSVAVGATLCGSVTIGENAYISNSIVRNQCKIGDNAFVGMGSVVLKDVPADTTVVGSPARPLERKKE